MIPVLYLSLAVASISFTISETRLFAPLRTWIMDRNAFVGEIVSCGYCLGHWVAFALVFVYRPRLFQSWWMLDYVLTGLVIAWLSGFQWALMSWFMDKAGK